MEFLLRVKGTDRPNRVSAIQRGMTGDSMEPVGRRGRESAQPHAERALL
jgi:hypothetical protein